MSLYNILAGMNTSLVVAASTVVGFRIDEHFPRFRDVFTDADDAPFEADLYVYTRMGGGNRDCWEGASYDIPCNCSGCRADKIEDESWCVGSYDDDFDCTYRTFGIKFTPQQKAEWDALMANGPDESFIKRACAMFPSTATENQRVGFTLAMEQS